MSHGTTFKIHSRNDELKKSVIESLSDDEYILRAKKIQEHIPYFYDSSTKFFYVYDPIDEIYRRMDDEEIIAFFFDYLDGELRGNITKAINKNRFLTALKLIGLRWRPKEPKKTWIRFKDRIVDIETGKEFEPTPEFLFVNVIPWKLGDSEDTPMIDSLFKDWVGDERKELLYEIFSYCLLPEYPIHRAFIFYGKGRNGKSACLRLLRKFVGSENVVSTDLRKLSSSRFECAKLYQKLVCEASEVSHKVLNDTVLLKKLTGGDLIDGEFKFKSPFQFSNYAKIILATNSIPESEDRTDGFYSRWIILDFPNQFEEGKDIISEIPDWEFENLARKCIRYLKRLLERGKFLYDPSIEEKRSEYERRANPLKVFMEEYLEEDSEGKIPFWEFKERFLGWLEDNGYRIWSDTEIGRKLREAGIEKGRKWFDIGGERRQWTAILGYRWRKDVGVCDGCEGCEESSILIENSKNTINKETLHTYHTLHTTTSDEMIEWSPGKDYESNEPAILHAIFGNPSDKELRRRLLELIRNSEFWEARDLLLNSVVRKVEIRDEDIGLRFRRLLTGDKERNIEKLREEIFYLIYDKRDTLIPKLEEMVENDLQKQ